MSDTIPSMILKNKTIFLTGGAGFMGSHLIETLSPNNKLVIFDNFSAAVVSEEWCKKFPHISVHTGDMREEAKLTDAMQGSDIVINLAAAHIRLSLSKPVEVHEINTTGILSSLRAAKKAGVKQFVYISSSEIYGSATKPLLAEDHPKDPTTVYGVSKYVGELYTNYFHRHEGLPTQVIRLFNTYGPRAHFEDVYGEVIPRLCVRALAGLPPLIFGSGKQTRDFTYITDTIHGMIAAIQEDSLLGDTINIAYGKEIAITTIAEAICKQTGLSQGPTYLHARPNDVLRHAADTSKAQRILKWKPEVKVEDGIANFIAWLKQTYPHPKQLLNTIPEKNW